MVELPNGTLLVSGGPLDLLKGQYNIYVVMGPTIYRSTIQIESVKHAVTHSAKPFNGVHVTQ